MTIDVRACSLPVSRPKTCGNATSLVQRVRSVVHARWLVQTHVCARDMPRPCTRRGRVGTARVLHLSWCGSIDVVVQAGVQPGQTLSLLQCRRRRICRACQAREWRSWRTHGLPLWTVDAGRAREHAPPPRNWTAALEHLHAAPDLTLSTCWLPQSVQDPFKHQQHVHVQW